MRPPHPAAGSWRTWALAAALLVGVNALLTQTPLIWGKTALWVKAADEPLKWMGFWQVYDVARTLHQPRRPAAQRVVILGNSLVWFAGQAPFVERALHERRPGADVRVDTLAFFGASVGDMEVVSREIARLHPTLVVLTLSGVELVATRHRQLLNPTGRLLDAGWRDGPIAPHSPADRADRWLRTAWPMYRWRRFARAGLLDRLWPAAADREVPAHFATPRDVLEFLEGARGAAAAEAFEHFRRQPTLDRFTAFLRARGIPAEPLDPLPDPATLTPASPGVRVLDVLLARLAAGPWQTLIVLMPENPLLADDPEGRYHRRGFSERAAALIGAAATRHGLQVVDGRRWVPAEGFIDFIHVWPDVSGFQTHLAEEILRAAPS